MTIRPLAFFVALTCGGFLCLTESPSNAGMENLIPLGDINPSPIVEISAVGPGASTSSSAFFSASDTEHGTELRRYNGGSATLWKDVRPGPESSHPTQFTSVGSYVVYVTDNGVHSPELYTTAPGWVPSVVGGGSVLRHTFIRATSLSQGYALAVECSPDMTPLSWVSIATKTENAAWTGDATVTETTLPDGRVQVEVDAPISGNCRFFRLQATY